MLAQLTPEQVSGLWGLLKPGVEASLPPVAGDAPDKINRILTNLMQGTMQCWLAYENGEDEKQLKAMAVTMIRDDYASGQRDLLIYCLYAFAAVDDWLTYFAPMTKWAVKNKCKRVTAYSANERIFQVAKRLGGNADYRFIEIPIQP